jgi:hypothetical protein
LGFAARRIVGSCSETEIVILQQKEELLLKESEDSKLAALEVFKKSAKGKGKDKEIPPESLNTPQVIAYEKFMRDARLSEENIESFVKFRLSWEDAGYGIVIDGVASELCPAEHVVQGLCKAMDKASVILINVDGDSDSYSSKLRSLFKTKKFEEEFIKRAYERSILVAKKPVSSSKSTAQRKVPIKKIASGTH